MKFIDWIITDGVDFSTELQTLSPTLLNTLKKLCKNYTMKVEDVDVNLGWILINSQVIETIELKILKQVDIYGLASIDTITTNTSDDIANDTSNDVNTNTSENVEVINNIINTGTNSIGTVNYQNSNTDNDSNNSNTNTFSSTNDNVKDMTKNNTFNGNVSTIDIEKFFTYKFQAYYIPLVREYIETFLINVYSL